MALDLSIVRLLERLAAAAEKIATNGIVIHHHHYQHESTDPNVYKQFGWVPPTGPTTGGGTGA